MQKTVLITGGFGFLGRAVAHKFKQLDYRVVGIGRGRWGPEEASAHGFDVWLDASVSLSSLMTLNERFDLVVHCGGNGSVGYSLANPLQDFAKTVQGTSELLEFLRVTNSKALLVYPSSAGVYGAKEDAPIKETDSLNPISPYGYHKRIAEELLESYSKSYGIRVVVIRFFSIYGPGLTKQLLWDASSKLLAAVNNKAIFWGTGEETRDWIHVDDAAGLVLHLAKCTGALSGAANLQVINGASGIRVTVREVLTHLAAALGSATDIRFNGAFRAGDPRFYHADITQLRASEWRPSVSLDQGLADYAVWMGTYLKNDLLQ
jgi:UDP-glucose 4-epimerase